MGGEAKAVIDFNQSFSFKKTLYLASALKWLRAEFGFYFFGFVKELKCLYHALILWAIRGLLTY